VAEIAKGALVAFWHDQGTHHAGALTYYALMSLFPLLLLAVSLLGLIGEYPATYNAIIHHLHTVVPANALSTVNDGLKAALRNRGTALAALLLGVFSAFYGATGYLEAARRAFNVIFAVRRGRSFIRRKLTDIASTVVLLVLVISTVVLMFGSVHVVRALAGSDAASVWRIGRWPLAVLIALLVFSFLYHVTPDTPNRGMRSIISGAAVGVTIWLLASAGFSVFLASVSSLDATYGSFAAVVVLLVWLWLTNVALFFGAEVNAQIALHGRGSEMSSDPSARRGSSA
jgi:membrane protein